MLEQIQKWDFAILHTIHEKLSHPLLDEVLIILSRLGNSATVWIVIGVFLLFFRKWRISGVKLLLALLIGLFLINMGLKEWVGRLRPFQIDPSIALLIPEPGEFSFPSGHANSSMAAATVLLREKVPGRYFALFIALVIAFSRIYLQVHFPTDILAGLLSGFLIGLSTCLLIDGLIKKSRGRLSELKND